MSNKCPQCGLVNPATAIACRRCGRAASSFSEAGANAYDPPGPPKAYGSYPSAQPIYETPVLPRQKKGLTAGLRVLAILIITLGSLVGVAGALLLSAGASRGDFLFQGVGMVISGVLIMRGQAAAVWIYFGTQVSVFLFVTVLYGVGPAVPRVFIALLIGLVLLRDNFRSQLA